MTLSEQIARPIMDANRAPAFVDLRAFVAEIGDELRALAQKGGDSAYLDNRIALISGGAASPIAALALPATSGIVEAMPHDEFVLVLKGRLHLVAGRNAYGIGPDEAAVIPHGCRFTWRAEEETVAIVMHYPESKAGSRSITPISMTPALAESAKPAADVLLGPAPDCRNFNDYRVDDGKFVCGTWDSTPYRRKGFLYQHFEIMLIRDGSVTFSVEDQAQTFNEGDIVLAEAGSHCAWDSAVPVTKMFAIYRT